MELIVDLNKIEKETLLKAHQLLSETREIVAREPTTLAEGIGILNDLRRAIYENLNQIQHEAVILRAVQSLQNEDFSGEKVEWYWNPRQTGSAKEPDLQGEVGGRIVVSAEITTSERPIGTIDQRMSTTLQKLSKMEGNLIYFVSTEAMGKRARTKVSDAGYPIEVRRV